MYFCVKALQTINSCISMEYFEKQNTYKQLHIIPIFCANINSVFTIHPSFPITVMLI